ncbi:hypothetical protein RHMOL_Rhmol08G0132400 [Rhododendron molle]|uniref:Uncharacterized protein n=1 Tax=Rhododendron molle TaxID=49168 RepID=A0ACC0MN77_RHOML|nr:hypothetical protein RHMOL_Rhmol08G0132400 [Rhododendron molle]
MAILCTAEGNKFVFSNENKLVHSWWPQSVEKIFPHSKKGATTKEESKKLRQFLPAFLKPDSLRKYVGVMDQLAKKHLRSYWDDREQVKVHCLMRKYTFSLGCKLLLNVDDRELIERLEGPFSKITAGFISLPLNVPGTKFNRAIKASRELHKDIEGERHEIRCAPFSVQEAQKQRGGLTVIPPSLSKKNRPNQTFNRTPAEATTTWQLLPSENSLRRCLLIVIEMELIVHRRC